MHNKNAQKDISLIYKYKHVLYNLYTQRIHLTLFVLFIKKINFVKK